MQTIKLCYSSIFSQNIIQKDNNKFQTTLQILKEYLFGLLLGIFKQKQIILVKKSMLNFMLKTLSFKNDEILKWQNYFVSFLFSRIPSNIPSNKFFNFKTESQKKYFQLRFIKQIKLSYQQKIQNVIGQDINLDETQNKFLKHKLLVNLTKYFLLLNFLNLFVYNLKMFKHNDNYTRKIPEYQKLDQIIIFQSDQEFDILIPAFISLKVNYFTNLNIDELYANFLGCLNLSVYFGELPDYVVDFIQSKMRLDFFMNPPIVLSAPDSDNVMIKRKTKRNKGKLSCKYKIHSNFISRIDPFVFLTPFQLLDLRLTAEFESNIYRVIENKRYNFKFNFLNIQKHGKFRSIRYSESGSIGYYDLAERKLTAEYTTQAAPSSIYLLKPTFNWMKGCIQNYSKKEKYKLQLKERRLDKVLKQLKNQEKVDFPNNKYAHFHLPLYKSTFVSLATIYFPLWLFNLINIELYIAEIELGLRLQGISLLFLGYIQLILVVRQKIPQIPGITMVEIVMYVSLFSTVLLLIQSLMANNQGSDESNKFNAFFIASLGIGLLFFLGPIFAYIYHRLKVIPSYNQTEVLQEPKLNFGNLQETPSKNQQIILNKMIAQNIKLLKRQKYPDDSLQYHTFLTHNLGNRKQWTITPYQFS